MIIISKKFIRTFFLVINVEKNIFAFHQDGFNVVFLSDRC